MAGVLEERDQTTPIRSSANAFAKALNDELEFPRKGSDLPNYFRRAVETGARVAELGEFATKEEIRTAFARWGVNIAD